MNTLSMLRRGAAILAFAGGLAFPWSAQGAPATAPTVASIYSLRKLPEPLVPAGPAPTAVDNQSLMAALAAFESRKKADDFAALENFVAANPASPWRLAVETNLGILDYHAGYFSRCMAAYLDAWNTGKGATDLKAKTLADRAGAEYSQMLARVGRYEELKAFLKDVQGRTFAGPAGPLIQESREGAVMMEKRPELSFRCGPMALSRILASEKSPLATSPDILNSKSTREGISLADVAALSKKLGLNYQVARRAPGAPLIMPSVIHWNVGHYAALIQKVGERYLTEDPTFENATWHTLDALEAEASGYFLVPPGPLPNGWTSVSNEQAKLVFGKGNVSTKAKCGPCDKKGGGSGGGCGMAGYTVDLMLASLTVMDTPVGYNPPYGVAVPFAVTYTQLEDFQPANFNYSNFGAQWNFNWLTYITDDPNNPATASQATPGGGSITYSYGGVNGSNNVFATQFDTYQQLSRPTSGLPYTVVYPDGSQAIFGQPDGSTVAPRNVFLTQVIDPQGNATTLTYDNQLRITAITDSLGRQTTLTYGNPSDIYKITQVTDPFGRSATFSYDASGRLVQTQDVIGIQSVFTYAGSSNFINSLTTPYGTTNFTTTTDGLSQRLTATDPAGDTEVVESNGNQLTEVPSFETEVPQGLTTATNFNEYLAYRNTYFWNKKQWKEYPNVYTQAHIYHWMHDQNITVMSRYLESEKAPLQSRIWYAYPGQTAYIQPGTQSAPTAIGRAIEGGSQISSRTLNPLGLPTSVTDPLGRTTSYQYAANNIDILSVSQAANGGAVTLGTCTYNTQHEPLTYTDAAGQVTSFTYNAQGQVTSVTDPLNNTTTVAYYTADAAGHQRNGRIYQVIGALPGKTDVTTFDYDGYGRTSSATGPDGYALAYSYDSMDRLIQITYPDGTTSKTTYFALDPQTSVDRLGLTTRYGYNSLRQLISVTDPLSRTTQYRYCRCGALSQVIDAMGRATAWRHDTAGHATSKIFADGSTINYSYEPLSGRLSTATDEKNQVKTYAYNLDNTLASITYTNAQVATPGVSYSYDPNFLRPTGMTDGTGSTTYAYYPIAPGTIGAGQISTETGPLANAAVSYTYDADGRKIGWTINGVGETHILDPAGRVTSLTNPLGTFGYTYDGATNRPFNVTYPNGVTCAYDYQPLTGDFRLKDITHTLSGNNLLFQNSYLFDVGGRMTRWTQNFPQGGISRSWSCGYDNAGQVISVASQNPSTLTNLPSGQYGYSYDPAANRLGITLDGGTTTANFNALNQQGTLSSGTTPALPPQTYEWDAEDRVTAINYTSTNQRTQFQYDGSGRRVRITELQGGATTTDTRFVWRGLNLAEARDTTGANVQTRYFAQGVQAVTGAAPGSYYYLRDHLGSIRALTDATGNIRVGYDYDAYGVSTKLLGDLDTDERFTGFYNHAPSGLALAVFRVCNPNLGRWLSRDPVQENGGLNLYAYVGNRVLTAIDPLGFYTSTAGTNGTTNYTLTGPNDYTPTLNPNDTVSISGGNSEGSWAQRWTYQSPGQFMVSRWDMKNQPCGKPSGSWSTNVPTQMSAHQDPTNPNSPMVPATYLYWPDAPATTTTNNNATGDVGTVITNGKAVMINNNSPVPSPSTNGLDGPYVGPTAAPPVNTPTSPSDGPYVGPTGSPPPATCPTNTLPFKSSYGNF